MITTVCLRSATVAFNIVNSYLSNLFASFTNYVILKVLNCNCIERIITWNDQMCRIMSFPYIVVGRYTLLITIAKIQKKILKENNIHSD